VILLSSDDEDEQAESQNSSQQNSLTPTIPANSKEPVYTTLEMQPTAPEPDATMPDEPDGAFTCLMVKDLRIGNFRVDLKDSLLVSSAGLQFTAANCLDGMFGFYQNADLS